MRCPDCNKFVGLEMQDPELEDIQVETSDPGFATVTMTVRIVRACAECGTELKEATLEIEETVDLQEALKALDEGTRAKLLTEDGDWGEEVLEIEESGVEQIEEGGGRYAKSYFGAQVTFEINFEDKTLYEGTASDKVAASEMEEMV